jgi:hypothetical protein
MKKTIIFPVILMVLAWGCKKENSNPSQSFPNTDAPNIVGKWKIDSTITTLRDTNGNAIISKKKEFPYYLEFLSSNVAYYIKTKPVDTTVYTFINPGTLLMDLNNDNKQDTTGLREIITGKQVEISGKTGSGNVTIKYFLSK